MASCCAPLGYAGCKWQSGNPDNSRLGLPYIQGVYVLNENTSGQMVAIMDAKWITGKRTAAASALVARYQARKDSTELAILGCGVQGRAHLEVLAAELPSLTSCRAYDIVPGVQQKFIEQFDQRYNNIKVIGAAGPEEALWDADLIITGGAITREHQPTIVSEWIKSGALIITIDYDSYVTDQCIAAMDLVLTDDTSQIEDARKQEGKFLGVPTADAEIAEMIAHGKGLRLNDTQRIIAFNLGIALEDVATAATIFETARDLGIGTLLET